MTRSLFALLSLLAACSGAPTEALDGGLPDGGAACPSCSVLDCHFGALVPAGEHLVLRFERGGTEVLLARAAVGQGAGFSTIYEARGLAVRRSGALQCLTAALDYENSHHNWFDHAFAENAARERYELEIKFQPPGQDPLVEWVWTYTLRGKDAAGGALFADELLDLLSGRP